MSQFDDLHKLHTKRLILIFLEKGQKGLEDALFMAMENAARLGYKTGYDIGIIDAKKDS